MDGLAEFYLRGGVFMHWIAVVAGVGLLVCAERVWTLVLCQRLDAAGLFRGVEDRLLHSDTELAVGLCDGRSAVAEVVRAGLMASTDRTRARMAVSEVQEAWVSLLTRRIPTIGSLASIAALVGLLGTVDGFIVGSTSVSTVTAVQLPPAKCLKRLG
jgi:biopolymer transport protein ExbB/TolQ